MFENFDIIRFILTIPALLLTLTIHEYAHGYAAMKLGDPTARNLGRLTLNPLKHLDPLGALCMLFFHFGWAKPVPINARYFKNPRKDMALTALAGPTSNVILAFIGVILLCVFQNIFNAFPPNSEFIYNIYDLTFVFFSIFISLNASFAIFNMLPVPPLDGSRFFYVFLPSKWYFGIMKYERYIMLAMFLLIWGGAFDIILGTLAQNLISLMFKAVRIVPFFR